MKCHRYVRWYVGESSRLNLVSWIPCSAHHLEYWQCFSVQRQTDKFIEIEQKMKLNSGFAKATVEKIIDMYEILLKFVAIKQRKTYKYTAIYRSVKVWKWSLLFDGICEKSPSHHHNVFLIWQVIALRFLGKCAQRSSIHRAQYHEFETAERI